MITSGISVYGDQNLSPIRRHFFLFVGLRYTWENFKVQWSGEKISLNQNWEKSLHFYKRPFWKPYVYQVTQVEGEFQSKISIIVYALDEPLTTSLPVPSSGLNTTMATKNG